MTDRVTPDTRISFLGMKDVLETGITRCGEPRAYTEVARGYTPFKAGDLLIAKITPCFQNNKIAQADISHTLGFGSTEFHVIRPKPDAADPRYVLHFLRQEAVRRAGEHQMTGSAGQKRVPVHFLATLRLPLPPLTEQRRIVDILDQADKLRSQRRQALAQLDDLSHAIFIEMFGDPVINPRQWPNPTLGKLLTFQQYGPRFYNQAYSPEGVKIIRITDLNESGELDFSAMPRLSVTSEEREKYALRAGDLLFARTGATVGKVALIHPNDPVCIAGAYFINMRFDATVEPVYVRAVLTSPSIRAVVAKQSRQAAQQNFSGPALRRLPMPVPPLELQRRFVRIANTVDKLRAAHRGSLAQSNALFSSLEHRAFRGEL